ncbi:DNA mismatch repair protein Mlh3-like isoform X3 [Acipenser oxyrinchus oxyrinchus]|uniref:DNA mismatch repair protein Mlh3-like isoform X3 n=1 Tax=Acipenser oxyrinchus oxyrinchus TaxID=40147 RepID=A0AAD8FNF4_ACIOX|nr:DNA mismatch repair protein Mlh3-like isoform X3 [Acipenser oxyrinchus oxyrinchus]KAK1150435.1 DNA mismatch repair protein Mlh3-like isoform X3 [Acipenser oxyrinchus oxyrinchus]
MFVNLKDLEETQGERRLQDHFLLQARFEDASKKKEIPSTTQSSSDWVEHFDVSVGRMAYINTVTGLSKYVAPPEEETQAICTTDITTMAVNVVSEKVFCFKCFLFVSVNPINRSGARDPAPDSSQSPSFPSLPW